MQFRYALPEGDATVEVTPNDHGYAVTIVRPGQKALVYQVDAQPPKHGRLTLRFADRRLRAHVARAGTTRFVAMDGLTWRLKPPAPRRRQSETGTGLLAAAMPGKVLDVLVSEGQTVEAGAALVILEAMKMELRMTAPGSGRVTGVRVQPGDIVMQGQILIELKETP
jgi:3-methylcrotonyl-CoA carboxylase alpha subunit